MKNVCLLTPFCFIRAGSCVMPRRLLASRDASKSAVAAKERAEVIEGGTV